MHAPERGAGASHMQKIGQCQSGFKLFPYKIKTGISHKIWGDGPA